VAGGKVTLSNATLSGNRATGGSGGNSKGGVGGSGGKGGEGSPSGAHGAFGNNGYGSPGGAGGAAAGGGLYTASGGTTTAANISIVQNIATVGTGGSGSTAEGGAIYSSGTLSVSAGTVKSNTAMANVAVTAIAVSGDAASGGGIYVNGGTVTLNNATLSSNKAHGGNGGNGGASGDGSDGGAGLGGGVDVAGGIVTLTNDTLSTNKAQGGNAGSEGNHINIGPGSTGGAGSGGGVFVGAGTVTLVNDTLSSNDADGGTGGNGGAGFKGFGDSGTPGGSGGAGSGGGMDVAAGTVTLTNGTLSSNQANGGTGGVGGTGGTVGGVAAGGVGGSGGNAKGGGLYLVSGSVTHLTNTLIAQDTATAGSGGPGGSGQPDGQPGSSGSATGPDIYGNVASGDRDLIGNGTGSNLTNGNNFDQVGSAPPFTGDLTQGSLATIANVSSMSGLVVGQLVTDTAGALPAGTVITGLGTDSITLSQAATQPQTGDTFTSSIDADLGPLQNNGGPLAGAPGSQQVVPTMALLMVNGTPSPAIDKGDSNAPGLPSTDQTGRPRISGSAVDIGAYEMQQAILSSATLPDGIVGTTYSQTLPAATQAGYQNSWGSFTYTTDETKLPPGLSLASDGTLSGVPTTTGPFSFTVVAADLAGFGTQTYTVTVKIGTSSLLRSAPGASVFGQAAAFLAVVTATSTGGTPTGTVDFKDGSTDLTPGGVTLTGGRATFTTAALSIGSHTITASYSGDSNFEVSTASTLQMVSKAATVTALTSSAAVSGQQIVFRATVRAVAPGTGIPAGTVDFKDGATDLTPGGVTLSVGEATFSTTAMAVGSHTITAIYSGGPRYTTSQVNDAPQVVNKDASHTVLTSFPDPAVFGQVVTFTVIVRSVPLGSGTPTGMVTFLDGTKTLGSMTLDSTARATFSTASLSRGNHAISVNYSGDTKFLPSSYTGFGEPVQKDATTATVTASANPAVVGTTVTFTAALQASSPGAGIPTGTVTFLDINTMLGTGTLNAAGKATFTTSTLALGTHAISASYAGDTNFLSSYSPNISEVVTASVRAALVTPRTALLPSMASSTSVSSAPNPSVLGQEVTFLATISSVIPGLPPQTGAVDFKEGNTDLTPGGVPLVGPGQAFFTTSDLTVGSHTITAVYSGDDIFTGSQGDDSASPQIVNKDGTSNLLVSVPGATVFGQPAAFFVFVTAADPAAGTPTGTVTFQEGTTVLGANVSLSGGYATFTTASLSVGSHTITAVYSGDSNFTGSQTDDSASPLVVSKDGTTTALTSSQKTTVSGENVVFRATVRAVAPGTRIPAGTVDFKDGATDLTPGGVTLSAGEATFSTTALAVGSHTITAIYSGGPRYTTSQVNDAPQVVNKDASHTVLTSFPDPAVFGQVVTFTVIVRSVPLGSGTPTGMVTFLDGTKTLGSMTLDGTARATFSTASLSRGNHAISVNYSGDGNFLTSTYTNFGEPVQKDATTATVTASANPAVVGTTVTFTAALQANSPGAGIPTGTVTFLDLTTTLGTGTLNAAGKATFTTSALALGTHAISASYAGDNNFQASASPTLAETIKSSTRAVTRSSALAFSATRPTDPVLGTAKSTLATPSAEAQGVRRAILAQGSAAEPTAATWDPSQLDRYFAAVTTPSAVRRLGQRAVPRHDPADWVDDPFFLTN
jgi:hypothetical protein